MGVDRIGGGSIYYTEVKRSDGNTRYDLSNIQIVNDLQMERTRYLVSAIIQAGLGRTG